MLEEVGKDLKKSYLVYAEDGSTVFVNWPEQVTSVPKTHFIRPVIAEIKSEYTLGQLKSKTPNFEPDSVQGFIFNITKELLQTVIYCRETTFSAKLIEKTLFFVIET